MQQARLTDIRNALEAVMSAIAKSGDGNISNSRIIEQLRTEYGSLIDQLSRQLINIALTKLANEVGSRKGPRLVTEGAPDLFGAYPGVPKVLSMGKGVKKSTLKSTFSEAEKWITEHETKVAINRERNDGFKQLLDKYRPYMSASSDTIEDAIRREREQNSVFEQRNLF